MVNTAIIVRRRHDNILVNEIDIFDRIRCLGQACRNDLKAVRDVMGRCRRFLVPIINMSRDHESGNIHVFLNGICGILVLTRMIGIPCSLGKRSRFGLAVKLRIRIACLLFGDRMFTFMDVFVGRSVRQSG